DRHDAGRIFVAGQQMRIRRPGDAVRAGIGLVPESRKDQGVVLDMPIRVNATMARLDPLTNLVGVVRRRAERQAVDALSDQLRIKASSQDASVSSLSGGNHQKVV